MLDELVEKIESGHVIIENTLRVVSSAYLDVYPNRVVGDINHANPFNAAPDTGICFGIADLVIRHCHSIGLEGVSIGVIWRRYHQPYSNVPDFPAHACLVYYDRYYDVEAPAGVRFFDSLPFIKEYEGKGSHYLREDENFKPPHLSELLYATLTSVIKQQGI